MERGYPIDRLVFPPDILKIVGYIIRIINVHYFYTFDLAQTNKHL
jgi:hypothetical protein